MYAGSSPSTDEKLRRRFRDREAAVRRELAELPPGERYRPDRMTPGMARLDELYVASSYLRSRDPVVRRYRRVELRSADEAEERPS